MYVCMFVCLYVCMYAFVCTPPAARVVGVQLHPEVVDEPLKMFGLHTYVHIYVHILHLIYQFPLTAVAFSTTPP